MDIAVFARIRPKIKSDNASLEPLSLEGNRITGGGVTCSFDAVFGADTTNETVYERAVRPLVRSFVEGTNTALLVLGESGAGKTHSLAGSSGVGGLMTFLFHEVFELVASRGSLSANVSCWQLHGEMLADGLSRATGLALADDPARGPVVAGLTTTEVGTAEDCLSAYRMFCATRAGAGRSTADRTHYAFTLELLQGTVVSRLTVCAVVGMEALAEDQAETRLRDGPARNKSVLAFSRLLPSIASGSVELLAAPQSRLTTLLTETLGGNCRVAALVPLLPAATRATPLVLAAAASLTKIVTYPVANSSLLRGLERRHRSIALAIRAESAAAPGGAGDGGRVQDIEGRLIKTNLEKLKSQEEASRSMATVGELRDRVARLAAERTQLSSALLQCEEEKLTLEKNLIELKIENNRMSEEAETKSFEQVNKILALESAAFELQLKHDTATKAARDLQGQLATVEAELSGLQTRHAELTTAHEKLVEEHRGEVERGQSAAAEIVTLTAARADLMAERNKLLFELEQIGSAGPGVVRTKTESELQRFRFQLDHLAADLGGRHTALQQRNVDLETDNSTMQRRLLSLAESKTAELKALRASMTSELAKADERLQSMSTQLATARRQALLSEREASEARLGLADAQTMLTSMRSAVDRAAQTHAQLVEEHQSKLRKYASDASKGFQQGAARTHIDAVLLDLARTQQQHDAIWAQANATLTSYTNFLLQRCAQLTDLLRSRDLDAEARVAGGTPRHATPHTPLPAIGAADGIANELSPFRDALEALTRQLAALQTSEGASASGMGAAGHAQQAGAGSWDELRRTLREHTAGAQSALERERAELLVRCATAEEKARRLDDYIASNMALYQREIVRLREQLGRGAK
eukprot:m.81693 g.81693  ORF g.81693 m.81693 type:complete len:876 (+) comp13373_c2_seq3:158-2785(+)